MKIKKTLLISLFAIASVIVKGQCYGGSIPLGGFYPCQYYDEWVLVFEDDFDGNSLDTSIWRNDYPWMRANHCGSFNGKDDNGEYYTDGGNIELEDGILKLIAKNEAVFEKAIPYEDDNYELFCNGAHAGLNKRWFNFTSGMIYSKQQFTYGKFEIRCKIPSIKKLWPAFWLFGECEQELDVFEFMSENDNAFFSNRNIDLTYHRRINCQTESKEQCGITLKYTNGWFTDMSEDFHTYSIEWDEHKLIWRIDNEEIWSVFKYHTQGGQELLLCGNIAQAYYVKDRIFPLDQPMNVIANLAVRPSSNSTFPAQMEIDYIRVYQKINSQKIVEICSEEDINGSTVAGKEILVAGSNCEVIIPPESYLNLVGKNNIVLNPGFSVKNGGYFTAKLTGTTMLKSDKNVADSTKEVIGRSFQVHNDNSMVITDEQIQIYPNPANTSISVTSNNLNQFDELNLYDLNGQLVYTNKIESENSMSIDVSLFRKGVYTLQIVSTKTLYHEKLIIQ